MARQYCGKERLNMVERVREVLLELTLSGAARRELKSSAQSAREGRASTGRGAPVLIVFPHYATLALKRRGGGRVHRLGRLVANSEVGHYMLLVPLCAS